MIVDVADPELHTRGVRHFVVVGQVELHARCTFVLDWTALHIHHRLALALDGAAKLGQLGRAQVLVAARVP